MKDIGYYAGFLTDYQSARINIAELPALVDALDDLASDLDIAHRYDKNIVVDTPLLTPEFQEKLSDPDKLALIRGLCDRIELKLKEAAK